jgi:hypothetical protein
VKPPLTPINLGSVAKGAAIELFEKAIDAVVRNIADTDTEAGAEREIVLKFKFKPEGDRRGIEILTTASTKLAGAMKHKSRAYVGKDTAGGQHLFLEDPRQDTLFDLPQQQDNLVDFKTPAAQ